MIPRSALRHRHSLLSSTSCLSKTSSSSPPTRRVQQQRRHAHTVPSLGQHNDHVLTNGFDGLYSPDALDQTWSRYMKMLLGRLNDILAGDRRENMSLKDVLIDTARNPSTANTFNYASMAHNNHFYFSTISPSTTPSEMPQPLIDAITRCFSSVHTFRSTFLTTAASMFGPGYVWLVQHNNPPGDAPNLDPSRRSENAPRFDLRIVPTYLAGSPYPGAHHRRQSRDLTTDNYQNIAANSPGSFGNAKNAALDGESNLDFGGADIMPLMCVSTWEHAYMLDWGADGKRLFLQAWWDKVDWAKVWSNAAVGANAARGQHGRPRRVQFQT